MAFPPRPMLHIGRGIHAEIMKNEFLNLDDAYVQVLQDFTGPLSHAPFVEAMVNEHPGFIGTAQFDFNDICSILEKVPAIESFSREAKRDMANGILHRSFIKTLENIFLKKNEDTFSGTDIYLDENESTIVIAVFVPDNEAKRIDEISKTFNAITPEIAADAFANEHLSPYAMCLNVERITKHIWSELMYAIGNGEEEPYSSYHTIIVDGADAENTVSISVKACFKEEGNQNGGYDYLSIHVVDDITCANCDVYTCDFLVHALHSTIADIAKNFFMKYSGSMTMAQVLNAYGEKADKNLWTVRVKDAAQGNSNATRLISVASDVLYHAEGEEASTSRWKWLVDGQYFDRDKFAAKYLLRRIEEIRTGIRTFDHEKQAVPDICGVDGRACRRPNACDSALCRHCPVAEAFFAKRDGILSLKYKEQTDSVRGWVRRTLWKREI